MSRRNDMFKKKIYDAEDATDEIVRFGRKFEGIRDAHQWIRLVQSVDVLLHDKPWISARKAHGNATASWADFDNFEIVLTDDGMCEQIILHELAHLATDREEPFHGNSWAWNYLDLTLRWRGLHAYTVMRDALRSTGVFG